MQQLARGDRDALAALVRRHQRRILTLAYRLTRDWSAAEDIAQDAFLRLWKAAPRYRPEARVTTLLHRIVVNLCLDAAKKRRPILGEVPETPAPNQAADGPFDVASASAAVRAAVADLPERQRIAVVLHKFSGLSQREVAEVTGWTPSAVESLLVRAYAALRERLADPDAPPDNNAADCRNPPARSFQPRRK